MARIINLSGDTIKFDDGHTIYTKHDQDCGEIHEIDTSGIDLSEVKDMEFDLSLPFDKLVEKVESYGIRLKSINSHPLNIPAYGYNNGYYSTDIDLILNKDGVTIWSVDISECQNITDDEKH